MQIIVSGKVHTSWNEVQNEESLRLRTVVWPDQCLPDHVLNDVIMPVGRPSGDARHNKGPLGFGLGMLSGIESYD